MKLRTLLLILAGSLLFLPGASVWGGEIVTPAEHGQFVEMLDAAGFKASDLTFLKDWDPSTKFKLSCQVEALNDPWKFMELLDGLKYNVQILSDYGSSVEGNALAHPVSILTDFTGYLDIPIPEETDLPQDQDRYNNIEKIRIPKDCLAYLKTLFDKSDILINNSLNQLSPVEQDSLFAWMYTAWQESEDSLAYTEFLAKRFPDIKSTMSTENAVRLLEKVDLATMNQAWNVWSGGIRKIQGKLHALKYDNRKPVYRSTKWGTMIIGTRGDDHYTNDNRLSRNPVCCILDPGGNDTYDCDLFTGRGHPFYLVIDLEGNDVYRSPAIARGMSVLAGCGSVIDCEGDDIYQYGDFAMSALLGLNHIIDHKGNDYYSTGLFSQGAAMFGISALQDNAGNDTYTATEFAQGLGGCKGFGLLLDGRGNDVYYCGGRYLHEPLAPFDYRSLAQGFGFGFRPELAGGIGILYDGEGSDRYSGGVYAQGVAYWYAIGALFDEKGNDYYDAVYYPQGSGIHLANGALVDLEGEDHYYSKHGPGQGNGHDWSVGLFVDKKGNDHYSVEGGNGLGLTNSVGIFIDGEGDDKYEHRNPSNYGFANAARETGGLGLFLDMGGKDAYPDSSKADNRDWQQGTYGLGRDIDINQPAQTKVEELAQQSTADVDSLDSISILFGAASEWEVGSAAERVKLARTYLLKREAEAVPYAINQKMATKSGLEYRALEELAKGSELMRASLYAVLRDPDSLKVKNAIALIAGRADSLAVDSLAVFLEQRKYLPTVLSALGGIKTEKTVDLLLPWLDSPVEKFRYLAARSLKSVNLPRALAALRNMGNDSSFLIKALVRQLPAAAAQP